MLRELKRFFVGEPLRSQDLGHTKIRKTKALAVLSSDALSSTAYATEEILLALSSVGAIAYIWSFPIALSIAVLMIIVGLSYAQTITYYPNGGGAYIVARENLGVKTGLVAGASLLIDYILTVSVSVAAGVSAISSAFPSLLTHKVALSCFCVLFIMSINLRGIQESATIFAVPTYVFIVSMFILIGVGLWKLTMEGFHAVSELPLADHTFPAVSVFLILRAFSSGCTAMTGIEAISNGVPNFQEPAHKNANKTLFVMISILAVLFLGVTFLAIGYHLQPLPQETLISQVARRSFGDGSPFYFLIQIATMMILILAANTSYADFPRLTSLIAKDRYLPRQFAALGDRLVFSNSVFGLSVAAMLILIIFSAETHAIVPLYAVGVFLSFSLSQAGMVRFHWKSRHKRWFLSAAINFLGAITTSIVMIVIAVTKFNHGAWIVVLLIPLFLWFFLTIHKHYLQVGRELALVGEGSTKPLERLKHTVVVPVSGVHRGVLEALSYAVSISDDVRACYVEIDSIQTDQVKAEWEKWAGEIPFVVLKSPYRSVIGPILQYIDDMEKISPHHLVTVIIPEFVTAKWWHTLLHNQTALLMRAALVLRRRKVVTSVRYHLKNS